MTRLRGHGARQNLDYCFVRAPVSVSVGPKFMRVTVTWVAVGFRCPDKEKVFGPFTFCVDPDTDTVAPVTMLFSISGFPTSTVDTPFTTDVPDALSEKSGFCAIVNVTTSGPYRLFVSVPLYVPFTGAMV